MHTHVLLLLVVFSQVTITANGYLEFAKRAYNNYQQVGAVAPFSKYTARAMIQEIKNYSGKMHYAADKELSLLEIGAGTGALTQYFVQFFAQTKIPFSLDLVELDPIFAQMLRDKFKNYPQVKVYHEDVLSWQAPKQYDIVISTLPYNCKDFTPMAVQSILDKIVTMVQAGGLYLSVEYIAMGPISYYLVWNKEKCIDYVEKTSVLEAFRRTYKTCIKRVFLNVPPTYIYATTIEK